MRYNHWLVKERGGIDEWMSDMCETEGYFRASYYIQLPRLQENAQGES